MIIVVQFGGTGDLARNKLIPAYHELCKNGEEFHVIALGRRYTTKDEFLREMTDISDKKFLERLHYTQYSMGNEEEDKKPAALIREIADQTNKKPEELETIYYLALQPELYETAIRSIKNIDRIVGGAEKKIVVEKPFGFDYESAEKYNGVLNEEFEDEEIYRVDHYLGKEFVQNLLVMRFNNDIIQSIWNKNFIDHIQIILNETSGVDQRLNFYEKTGVVRDMVQNHIMQIITHLTISEPLDFSPGEISHEKVKVLRSMRRIENFTLGKYRGLGGRENREVSAPTFAAFKLYVDTFDFSGVPIYVMTGKKQSCKCSTIYIKFKNFKNRTGLADNAMIITMQPKMSIDLTLNMKKPSESWGSQSIKLNFNHEETFKINTPEAYQQILEKIFRGDKTLFPRHPEIMEAWKIVEPMLEEKNIHEYDEGRSFEEAEKLIEDDGREWFI